MSSGSKCRHLNSAGRSLIMGYAAAYQTPSLSFCNTARLPDLDFAKRAVLNTLGSPESKRAYEFAVERLSSRGASRPGRLEGAMDECHIIEVVE